MMPISEYQDILWDFAPQGSSGSEEEHFVLSILSSEDELCAIHEDRNIPSLPVRLPVRELRSSQRSATRGLQGSISAEEAQYVGRNLWQCLPAEARDPLQQPLSPGASPRRIKISSNSLRIIDLPWEWLWTDDGALALRPDVRLARSVPVQLKIPPSTVTLPIRVLLILTNPKDEKMMLNNKIEISAVRESLVQPGYDLKVVEHATLASLREALETSPHILHYIGHAGINQGDGNIILHDQRDGTSWVSGSMLAKILPPTVRLICLSTCFSAPNYQLMGLPRLAHVQAEFQLPTMVTNRQPLQEPSVRTFWNAFYSELIQSGGNETEAVHKARVDAFNIDPAISDWASFALVIRNRTGQSMKLGVESPSADVADRKALEFQVQYASEVVNDLAEQTRLMGKDAPPALRKLFQREAERAIKWKSMLKD